MSQSEQNVHIQLTIDGAAVEGAVALPAAPSPRRVLLPVLRQLADTAVRIAGQYAAATGHAISCRKGCAACCRQLVPISPTEAYGLAAVVERMPAERARRVFARFERALARLDAAGVLERLLRRHKLSPDQQRQLDRDYFTAQVACPFLEREICSIHADRPLACREFLVTTPAEHCRHPTADRVVRVDLGAKVSVALAAAEKRAWLPLVLARDFVAAHRERVDRSPPAAVLRKILRRL